MSTIIHVELDALCFLILAVIAYQITRSVSKQMNRVLFRTLVYGIMFSLALDIVWVLTEGRIFTGAVIINKLTNALSEAVVHRINQVAGILMMGCAVVLFFRTLIVFHLISIPFIQ